jgi:hypothetical protein
MATRIWFVGIVTVSFMVAADCAAWPATSGSMQISLKIQENCQIASTASPAKPAEPPAVICLHHAPYRLSYVASPHAHDPTQLSAPRRVKSTPEGWEIEF